ncbi:MAG: ImmA/IrrE family metallo-endopeptidase [bacterium]
MDYSKFKTPYIRESEIKQKADATRNKYWGKSVPVDIERVMESKFGLSIIPLPGLYHDFGFDSFISSDWGHIYVDNDSYLDDAGYKRVRFSLAHELGHLILHKDLYESLQINAVEDYYRFYESVPVDQYSYLEIQANKFAGYFLVPRNILQGEFDKLKASKKDALVAAGLEGIDNDSLIDYVADDLAEVFNVSSFSLRICWNTIDK